MARIEWDAQRLKERQHILTASPWDHALKDFMAHTSHEQMEDYATKLMAFAIEHPRFTDNAWSVQQSHWYRFDGSIPIKRVESETQSRGINFVALRTIMLNINDPRHWLFFFDKNDGLNELNEASSKVCVIRPHHNETPAQLNAIQFAEMNQFFTFTLQHLATVAIYGNQYEAMMKTPVTTLPLLSAIPPEKFPGLQRGISDEEYDRIKVAMLQVSQDTDLFAEGISGGLASSPQEVVARLTKLLTSKKTYVALSRTRSFVAHSDKVHGEELRCLGQGYVGFLFYAIGQVLAHRPDMAEKFVTNISFAKPS